MNQERAREIAEKTWLEGHSLKTSRVVRDVADALHAAYEAEAQQHKNLLDDTGLTMENFRVATQAVAYAEDRARLASIKETARAILAANFASSSDTGLRGMYPTGTPTSVVDWGEALRADCDAAIRFAEALESAFERRYGGKP